jgi:hypothetical protein
VLVGTLALNAALGFAYRVYRLTKGGPMSDVIGQAILGMVLATLALGAALGHAWARWGALVYAVVFGVVVMPIWILAVLIPLRPRAPDYAFTGIYWFALLAIAVAALFA